MRSARPRSRGVDFPDFYIRVLSTDGRSIVRVSGDLDVHTAAPLRDSLARLIDGAARHVVVDLNDLSFMGASGLGVLVGASTQLRQSTANARALRSTPHARADRGLRARCVAGTDVIHSMLQKASGAPCRSRDGVGSDCVRGPLSAGQVCDKKANVCEPLLTAYPVPAFWAPAAHAITGHLEHHVGFARHRPEGAVNHFPPSTTTCGPVSTVLQG